MNDSCIFQFYETNKSMEYDHEYGSIHNKLIITWKSIEILNCNMMYDPFPIVLESVYSIKWIDWNFYDIK